MDIGTGIVLGAVWLMPTAAFLSKTTATAGVYFGVVVASILTGVLIW